MRLEILERPDREIIDLDDAKRFARLHLDLDDDDSMVMGLIQAAREFLEARVARCFLTTTVKETRVVPASGRIRLSRAPVSRLVSVEVDGEAQTPFPVFVPPNDLRFRPNARVVVTYKAGVDDVDDVPETAKTIVKMLMTHWYGRRTPTSRDAQNQVPLHVDALCDSLRWGGEIPR